MDNRPLLIQRGGLFIFRVSDETAGNRSKLNLSLLDCLTVNRNDCIAKGNFSETTWIQYKNSSTTSRAIQLKLDLK